MLLFELCLILANSHVNSEWTFNAFLAWGADPTPPRHEIILLRVLVMLQYLKIVVFVVVVRNIALIQSCRVYLCVVNEDMIILPLIKVLINWSCSLYNYVLYFIFLWAFVFLCSLFCFLGRR